jgi:hypothetical protein
MYLDQGLGLWDYQKQGETLEFFSSDTLTFSIADSVAIVL